MRTLGFIILLPMLSFAQSRNYTGYVPSSDRKYQIEKQGELVTVKSLVSDLTWRIDVPIDSLIADSQLYQYTVSEKEKEVEFSIYDRQIIEGQMKDSARIYNRDAALIKKLCYSLY